VIDFDVGLRNLDLVMGASAASSSTSVNVVQGVAKLSAGSDPRQGDWRRLVAAAGFADPGQDALTEVGVASVIKEMRASSDWVIAMVGRHRARATLAMRFADAAIILTNPEVSSVARFRSHHRPTRLQDREGRKGDRSRSTSSLPASIHNASARRMLTIDDVLEILSTHFSASSRKRGGACARTNVSLPVTLSNAASASARAYHDASCGSGRGCPDDHPRRAQRFLDKLFGERHEPIQPVRRRLSSSRPRAAAIFSCHTNAPSRGQPDLLGILREEILTHSASISPSIRTTSSCA